MNERRLDYRFFVALRPPLREPFFLGTFVPELPLFSVPRLRSCIARSTFSPAFLPYLAMHTLHTGSASHACSMPGTTKAASGRRARRTRSSKGPLRELRACRVAAFVLRAVSNNPSRLDVAGDAADGQACLVAQALGELDEAMRIGKVADDAERDADGARALAAAARHHIA